MRFVVLALLLIAIPAVAGDRAAARKAQTDELLDALKKAQVETEAVILELHLRQLWIEAGSPAVTLLMARGLRDLKAGSNAEAERDFDDSITLDPSVAEAYDQRAVARFQQGKIAGAVEDLEETLKREPRDFFALRHLSEIAEARHDWAGALAAWQKLMEIDPKTPGGEDKLKQLRRRALGENT